MEADEAVLDERTSIRTHWQRLQDVFSKRRLFVGLARIVLHITTIYDMYIFKKVLYYLFIKYTSKYLKHYSNIGIYYFQNSSRF